MSTDTIHRDRKGNGELVARDDKKGKAGATPRKPRPGGDEVANGNVGNALRSVYNQTVGEDIPDEMLDLLGKLS